MIAYNHTSLDNLSINEEVTLALDQNLITKEEGAAIASTYPVNLYSPNLFIRIGLFLLTTVIVLMLFGLLMLMSDLNSETKFGVMTLILSLVLYAALEFLIKEKKHYGSGIDDALLWLSLAGIAGAVNLLDDPLSYLGQSVWLFIPALFFLLRFDNVLMGGLAYLSLLGIVFFSVIRLGPIAKTAMPFLLMAISLFVYWLSKTYKNKNQLRHYKKCGTVIEILSLITLYAAGNYFVVREVSNSMFGLNLKEGESVPGGWFFWITTIGLPALYIFRGIQKRNVILLRTGLILVAAIVFTIRYYHHIAPLEIAMSIGGIVMILIAYIVTQYLTPAKHGFTHAEPNDPKLAGLLQLESLVVTQTFHKTPAPEADKHFDFGGGSAGGAGASDTF